MAEDSLPPVVAIAQRVTEIRPALAEWSRPEISEFAPRSLDELLATDPAFSLFRRQNATFANPTTTGLSLRRTGATATSRTLVLRDGLPQNDPFGGWVPWLRYQPSSLESVRILPSSESAAWGNLSPAGVVHLTSRPVLQPELLVQGGGGQQASGKVGLTSHHLSPDGRTGLSFHLSHFRSDGFQDLDPTQRGPLDEPLDLTANVAELRLRTQLEPRWTLETQLAWFEEERGNGTPLSGNRTQALDLSLRLTHQGRDSLTQALLYLQERAFQAAFTAVDEARESERLALDQFDVPSRSAGGAWSHRRPLGEALTLTHGLDLRWIEGETNEVAGTFRQRRAGGEQSFFGLFGTLRWDPSPETSVATSLRVDRWGFHRGIREESVPSTGRSLRSEQFPDREGYEPSFSLALDQQLAGDWQGRLALGTSYRAPTLNELYRPFRVQNDITEANPELDPERFFTLEAGLDWQASDPLQFSLEVFHHWIDQAIANVPVTEGADLSRLFGTLPAGGSGAQRQNVEQATVWGAQVGADWQLHPLWQLSVNALWSQTEFSDSPRQPLLEGRPFPQSPEWQAHSQIEFRPRESLRFFFGIEYTSRAFDDALATRALSSYWTARLGAGWQASDHLTLRLRIENLFDEAIPTGESSNGLRRLGQPRSAWVSADYLF